MHPCNKETKLKGIIMKFMKANAKTHDASDMQMLLLNNLMCLFINPAPNHIPLLSVSMMA